MPYIFQWKGLLEFFHQRNITVTVDTLKYWHKKVKPIPFLKTPGKNGRVYIESRPLLKWFRSISH